MHIEVERDRLRRNHILELLYQRYPYPSSDETLTETLRDRPDLAATRNNIRSDLDYFLDRGWVMLAGDEHIQMTTLTANGVDVVELTESYREIAQQNRLLRLRALMVLAYAGHQPVSEALLVAPLKRERDLDVTSDSVHRALCYLSQRGLCRQLDRQLVKISADGVDYLDGYSEDRAGVARPAKL